MKKGCFLSLVILLTICIGVGLYLYKYKKEDIKRFGKKNVVSLVSNDIESHLDKLKQGIYNDSLRVLVKREFKLPEKEDFSETMDQIGNFAKRFKDYSRDLKIDSLEFANLKQMVLQHEGSKKN